MKASVPLLGGCVALGFTLAATESWAAPLPAGLWAVAAAGAGQIGGGRDKRAESDKLLSQAQKAIKQGDYAQAESLIGQAEKLGIKYHPLTERFVDTPDKVRKALAEARSKVSANRSVARAPALLENNPPQKQPSAIPLDPIAGAPQAVNPPASNVADERIPDDAKSRAAMHLQDARRLLAAGDKLAAFFPAQWDPKLGIHVT